MGDFKLKIAIGNAQIELEGEGELVHTIFQELRETGLGNISPLVKAEKQIQGDKPDNQNDSDELPHKPMETSPQYDSTLDFELPSLNNVVMQGLPQKESEWLLIYALYASNCGSQFFTKEDLFTMLRTVEESTSFDLFSAIANAKRSKNYFVNGSTPRSYTITHIGEDYVKKLEISQREDK